MRKNNFIATIFVFLFFLELGATEASLPSNGLSHPTTFTDTRKLKLPLSSNKIQGNSLKIKEDILKSNISNHSPISSISTSSPIIGSGIQTIPRTIGGKNISASTTLPSVTAHGSGLSLNNNHSKIVSSGFSSGITDSYKYGTNYRTNGLSVGAKNNATYGSSTASNRSFGSYNSLGFNRNTSSSISKISQ